MTRPGWLAPVVVALLAWLPASAWAETPFRIAYDLDTSVAERVQVRGTVVNEARFDVVDVYVTAEALDAGGKVVARGVTFAAASLPRKARATFVANVPAVKGTASYRVIVSSFRPSLAAEAPSPRFPGRGSTESP